ncbi:PaaI family thioesterase [Sphaerisporangium album]|uniref:PaaI family thioesterase n=1 Tax=Sphaerisporangium album TaxID=509200 RepID=A0A367EFU7_9ACTN|nr:PaaI family thioesterase [Sphaerisporangium album]RCG16921.1 PaaI family thioesterase [Sphaerisporangium album]
MTRRPHRPGYEGCYACGADAVGGLRVRVVGDGPDGLVANARLGTSHQGAPGIAHGGIVAAVLDEVISLTLWRVLDRPCVTRRLEVDFLAPVPIGRDVELRAQCTETQGRKVRARAEALFDGQVRARADGLFIEVPEHHFTHHRG